MSAPGSGKSAADEDETSAAQVSLELSAAEVDALLRIVRRYRPSIPTYLKSSQAELNLVDELIRKLSELV